MKRLFAWMLVCLMALTPIQCLAYESPADAAYAEGKLVRTTYTFVPETVPFFDETIQAAYDDLLNALNIVLVRQDNAESGSAGGFALGLAGENGGSVLDLVWGADGEGLYLMSEGGMLGEGVLAFTQTGVVEELVKLINAVSQLFGGPEITMAMVEEALAQNANSAQQMMEAVTPMLEAVGTKMMGILAKTQMMTVAVESDKHDAADTTVTLDMETEDIAGVYDVLVEELLKIDEFNQFLYLAEVTTEDGQTLYGEEGAEYFKTQLKQVPEMIRQLGLDAKVEVLTAGEDLVAMIVTLTAEGEEEAVVLDYYRKTEGDTASHTFSIKGGEETLLDGLYAVTDLGTSQTNSLSVRMEEEPVVEGKWSSAANGNEQEGNLVFSDGYDAFGVTWSQLGDNWSFALEAASGGVSEFVLSLAYQQPDFTLRLEADGEAFVLAYDENETADAMAWSLDVGMEAGEQTASVLRLESKLAADENGGEQGTLALSVMGMPVATVKAETQAVDPVVWSSYTARSAVADMTAEDATAWVQNTVSSLMTQVMTFVQNIPQSVLVLLFGE